MLVKHCKKDCKKDCKQGERPSINRGWTRSIGPLWSYLFVIFISREQGEEAHIGERECASSLCSVQTPCIKSRTCHSGPIDRVQSRLIGDLTHTSQCIFCMIFLMLVKDFKQDFKKDFKQSARPSINRGWTRSIGPLWSYLFVIGSSREQVKEAHIGERECASSLCSVQTPCIRSRTCHSGPIDRVQSRFIGDLTHTSQCFTSMIFLMVVKHCKKDFKQGVRPSINRGWTRSIGPLWSYLFVIFISREQVKEA